MTQQPIQASPVERSGPVETLDEAVDRLHAAVNAAQAAGWRVTITVADNTKSSIKVSVARRVGSEGE